jgi:urease accessory protein
MNSRKNSLYVTLSILGVVAFFPLSAFAHPDHGATTVFASGFSHPFGGLDHWLAMVAVGLWAAQMGGRALWIVPGAFVSLMLFGGMLAMSGFHLPYVEAGILTSVMVLGVLVAAAFKFPLAISAAIVGLFALFHGHAHGAEMSMAKGMAMGAVSYSLGFALATALLHAFGITGGVILQQLNTDKVVRFAGGVIAVGGLFLSVA